MALRWCAADMVEAGKQFRRVNVHLHLPALRARALPRVRRSRTVVRNYRAQSRGERRLMLSRPPLKFHKTQEILAGGLNLESG